MWNNPTEIANAEYVADINAYLTSPVQACGKERSLGLLKQFARKDFCSFWTEPVIAYLPAVSEGTMKLAQKIYPHEKALEYAKSLYEAFDPRDLARAFLYGTAHNAPEYRTALACYYYIKNLPRHEFERKHVGSTSEGDVYCDHVCEVCKHNSKLSDEPKMQFWHINTTMAQFYLTAKVPNCFDLNTAITFLDEYQNLSKPACTSEDIVFFKKIIALIDELPENTPPSKLRKALKQSGLLCMTIAQIDAFIDMLGYLNILHTDDSFGVTVGHTMEKDMLYPLSDRSYFAHPVNRWTRRCGIDYQMLDFLFGSLY